MMNPHVSAPARPGRWVNEVRCVCGARYSAHRGSYGFSDAAMRLRQLAKDEGDPGGGFRSRRPVLWMLRTMKLADWYCEHAMCGSLVVTAPRTSRTLRVRRGGR